MSACAREPSITWRSCIVVASRWCEEVGDDEADFDPVLDEAVPALSVARSHDAVDSSDLLNRDVDGLPLLRTAHCYHRPRGGPTPGRPGRARLLAGRAAIPGEPLVWPRSCCRRRI